ncbi:MAG: hypothetical protein ACK58T_05630 [Phycisphaerae bacterium]|jgi:hypothetical protein
MSDEAKPIEGQQGMDAAAQPEPIGLEPLPEPAASPPPTSSPSAATPKPAASKPVVSGAAFIKPGMGSAQNIAIAGGVLLLVAVIGSIWTSWNAGTSWWANGLLTAYLGVVHACTGAAAAGFVGYALGREIGDIPLAAARMLLGVSLLLVTLNVNLPAHAILVWVCAVGLYAIATLVLFRWEIAEWAGVASVHALMWFVMFLAAKLQVAVAATAVKPA